MDRRFRGHRPRVLVLRPCAQRSPGDGLRRRLPPGLYELIYNKYFVDEFYDATVVRPVVDGSRTLLWRTADAGLIDGAVNGIGKTARSIGGALKLAQSGFIRSYAAWVVAGSIAVVIAMALWGTFDDASRHRSVPAAGGFFAPANAAESHVARRGSGIDLRWSSFRGGCSGLIALYWFASPTGYAFSTNVSWISYPPIRYHVGLDGLSLWLVILTTLLTPISVLVSWKSIDHRVKEFFAFLILLECGLIGVFVSVDLFLFYVFWEVSLVPMYFLIGIWGHDRRIYATVKFFLYTFAGSVLMLAGIIYLYNQSGSFDYLEIVSQIQTGRLALDSRAELLLFLAFFGSFAIKVPLFPLHTWLPDAHVEAPTAGSIMLASVMLKMGTYGLLRYCLPMFPNAAHQAAPWVAGLAITGIIYGALVAMVQPNMKKLVAYSSVSHLGLPCWGFSRSRSKGLMALCTRC